MNNKNDLITEDDKIYEIVMKYPAIKQKLLEISPKFQKLNNPLVFNTAARITTVKKAAKTGGVYLNEMLYQLNDAIGLGREFLEERKKIIYSMKNQYTNKELNPEREKKPDWMKDAGRFSMLDVSQKEEPFEEVIKKAGNMEKGEGFILIQKFVPHPVIGYLETQGFEHYTDSESGIYRIYFLRKEEA